MTTDQAISHAVKVFEGALMHLKDEYVKLQIGRANPGLVEGLIVEVYGSPQPLKAVAGVSIPDARTIQIQPWDKSNLAPIEKAISVSGMGLNPVNDGICVRINIPPLTQERRLELTKVVKKLAEDAHIAVRNGRQEAHNHFRTLKADNAVTEDDFHLADKSLQHKVDEVNKKIDEVAEAKEKDVMTV